MGGAREGLVVIGKPCGVFPQAQRLIILVRLGQPDLGGASDLARELEAGVAYLLVPGGHWVLNRWRCAQQGCAGLNLSVHILPLGIHPEIGRASCRERVCQYVSISVVAVSLKKKKKQT